MNNRQIWSLYAILPIDPHIQSPKTKHIGSCVRNEGTPNNLIAWRPEAKGTIARKNAILLSDTNDTVSSNPTRRICNDGLVRFAKFDSISEGASVPHAQRL